MIFWALIFGTLAGLAWASHKFWFKGASIKKKLLTTIGMAGLVLYIFSEEIYIYWKFREICAEFGGFTKLTPVEARTLSLSEGAGGLKYLEHPGIDAVFHLNNKNPEFGPKQFWLSKTPSTGLCADPINQIFLEKGAVGTGALVRKVNKDGFCYSTRDFPDTPRYVFSYESIENYKFPNGFDRQVRELRFEIKDMHDESLLSRFSYLRTNVGTLFSDMMLSAPYTCPNLHALGSFTEFPFRNREFYFLEKAILKEQK